MKKNYTQIDLLDKSGEVVYSEAISPRTKELIWRMMWALDKSPSQMMEMFIKDLSKEAKKK